MPLDQATHDDLWERAQRLHEEIGGNACSAPDCEWCRFVLFVFTGLDETFRAKARVDGIEPAPLDDEAVHGWFSLSYSNYFVMQRSVLQSMPGKWQRQFIALVDQIKTTLLMERVPDQFKVHAVDDRGKYVRDDYADYERGRRRLLSVLNAPYKMHVSISKEYLIREIMLRGPKSAFGKDYQGTAYEAVEKIVKFPTTESIPAAECDSYDERGCCKGHPITAEVSNG